MAYAIRKVFDDYAVNVISKATHASPMSWHREYTTEMTRDPNNETAAFGNWNVFDEMIDDCKVQVRLESVDFIETAEIVGNAPAPHLPWDDEQPNADHAVLMSSYIRAMSAVCGAHVFVVGNVNPGEFVSTDGASGIAPPGLNPGYALIGGLEQRGGSWTSKLQHEVGHVLGLDLEDKISAMFGHALTPAMCDKMRQHSRNLLQ